MYACIFSKEIIQERGVSLKQIFTTLMHENYFSIKVVRLFSVDSFYWKVYVSIFFTFNIK